MPEGSVRNFDEISDRLDQIIATVRSQGYVLGAFARFV